MSWAVTIFHVRLAYFCFRASARPQHLTLHGREHQNVPLAGAAGVKVCPHPRVQQARPAGSEALPGAGVGGGSWLRALPAGTRALPKPQPFPQRPKPFGGFGSSKQSISDHVPWGPGLPALVAKLRPCVFICLSQYALLVLLPQVGEI